MKRRANHKQLEDDKTVVRTLRWTGFIIAALQVVYILSTIADDPQILTVLPVFVGGLNVSFGLVVVLLAINTISFIRPPRSKHALGFMSLVFYSSLTLFSLWISDIDSVEVIAMSWLVLLTTTGMIYGRTALLTGDLVAILAVTIGWVITPYQDYGKVLTLYCVIGMAVFAAYFFYALREAGLIQLRNYDKLKVRERLQTRRLKAVVNNLNDALISIDVKGNINLYNAAALDLLDTNRDLINQDIDNVMTILDSNNHVIRLSELAINTTRTTEREDLFLAYPDSQKVNLHLSIIPVKDQFNTNKKLSSVGGFIVMMRDITKEKTLDDERDEFISVVSHELRTPVAIAEGALSNLQFLVEHNANIETFSPTLDAAHKQILYLGQMVNDLSTLSRAQRGVYMDDENIDVADFMMSLQQKYSKEASARKLDLIVENHVHGYIYVPSMVIEEMMQNLITNALKYTKSGSVTISADYVPHSDNKKVRFSVKDTGIGISKSDQPHVFQRFWRSEDYRTRETSGTGLGLHVVSQLADKIGVTIELTSELNVGSTFSFVLPINGRQTNAR